MSDVSTTFDHLIEAAKNRKWLAIVLVGGFGVIVVAQFFGALGVLWDFAVGEDTPFEVFVPSLDWRYQAGSETIDFRASLVFRNQSDATRSTGSVTLVFSRCPDLAPRTGIGPGGLERINVPSRDQVQRTLEARVAVDLLRLILGEEPTTGAALAEERRPCTTPPQPGHVYLGVEFNGFDLEDPLASRISGGGYLVLEAGEIVGGGYSPGRGLLLQQAR